MNITIEEKPIGKLIEYSTIPIRFEVRSIYDIKGDDPATAVFIEKLVEKPVPKPWIKGEGPNHWAESWDLSNWGMLIAEQDRRWIGGCVLAYNTDGVNKLEGRDDIAVLWDLRVQPDFRIKGIGKKLFESAVYWAKSRKCIELKIETQNINVPACKFYQKQGCRLDKINRFAYKDFPDEIELIWSLKL